jgi:hypothetical protein
MRTLNGTLAAHLTDSINTPAVVVTIDDRHIGMHRPRWATLTTDTIPAGPSATAATYNGYTLRAYINPSTNVLYVQRITNPATLSQWTTWTSLSTSVAALQTTFAADGTARQYIFYVGTGLQTLWTKYSDDNGVTWSAASAVATVASGHTITALCATLNGGLGTLHVYYADHNTAGETTHIWYNSRPETTGSWATPAQWSRSAVAHIYGLAVGSGEDLHVIACINSRIDHFAVAPAAPTTFPTPTQIIGADLAEITYSYPSIELGFNQLYYLFYLEANSLANYTRPAHLPFPGYDDWQMTPRPYNLTAPYGISAISDTDYHYITTPTTILRAAKWTDSATQRVDVSDDILDLEITEHLDEPGQLTLTLRNDDGRYATDLTSDYPPIRQGSQVQPKLGYTISGTELTSYLQPHWITHIKHARKRRRSHLTITAVNGWGILYRTTPDRVTTWTSHTIAQLLDHLLQGIGFSTDSDSNSLFTTSIATFTITPAHTWATYVKTLLNAISAQLVFRAIPASEDHWPSAQAYYFIPSLTSAYTIGDNMPILAADYSTHTNPHTHITAAGAIHHRDALDWDSIENDNTQRADHYNDQRITNATALQNLANALMAINTRATRPANLTMPPHPGIEPADTVHVHDTIIALNDDYLVVNINTIYDTVKGIYQQTLTLRDPA